MSFFCVIFFLLVGRVSPLRSALHAMLTSSWCVQSWRSHSLFLQSSRLGSFPVQLTSSKRIGPDPTPKRGTGVMSNPSEGRVSPNLQDTNELLRLDVDWFMCTERPGLVEWVHPVTCNQVVCTLLGYYSLSNHRHTLFPTDHGKRLPNGLRCSLYHLLTGQYHLEKRDTHNVW